MKENEQAFLELTERYKRMIYKVCYMYASDKEPIGDLFQDVILNLWKAFPSFRGESSEETWIYRVALNTCISQLRKQSKKPPMLPLSLEIESLADPKDDPMLRELYRIIRQLNTVERAIILLYLEDKPYEEIASLIGITKSNVGVKISRIKEKMKQMSNL
ncbi:MAG: sigma-70 family RNA polymerase sigma factor [Bacteroidales bacterium]